MVFLFFSSSIFFSYEKKNHLGRREKCFLCFYFASFFFFGLLWVFFGTQRRRCTKTKTVGRGEKFLSVFFFAAFIFPSLLGFFFHPDGYEYKKKKRKKKKNEKKKLRMLRFSFFLLRLVQHSLVALDFAKLLVLPEHPFFWNFHFRSTNEKKKSLFHFFDIDPSHFSCVFFLVREEMKAAIKYIFLHVVFKKRPAAVQLILNLFFILCNL